MDTLLKQYFSPEQRAQLELALEPSTASPFREGSDLNGLDALRDALETGMKTLSDESLEPQDRWDLLRPPVEQDSPSALKAVLKPGYSVRGSAGIGNAAAVPWVAIFAPGAETSARTGYYPVYLFAADGSAVYLSFNQAAGQLRGGAAALKKRALDLRTVVGAQEDMSPVIDLAIEQGLGFRYTAGNVFALRYARGEVPNGPQLAAELASILALQGRANAAGVEFDPEVEPAHLLFKWSSDREPRTVELHRQVAEEHGSVWWGRFGNPATSAMAEQKITSLRAQLDAGTSTHVYLYRQDQVWRGQLQEITADQAPVDEERRPEYYYSKDDCNLFARITGLEPLEVGWVQEHLLLASNPDPATLAGALARGFHGWRLTVSC